MRGMWGVLARVRGLMLLLAAILVAAIAPAQHTFASTGILLSNDGTKWAQTLPEPLFDSAIRWVPGDERTSRFYVRNDTDITAVMSVDILVGQVEDLLDTGDVRIDVRIAGGPWTTTAKSGTYHLSTGTAGAGATYPIDVRVRFLADSANISQIHVLDLRVLVTLTDANTTPVVDPDTPGNRPLSATGAAAGISALALLSLVPFLLLLAARRRRADEEVANG